MKGHARRLQTAFMPSLRDSAPLRTTFTPESLRSSGAIFGAHRGTVGTLYAQIPWSGGEYGLTGHFYVAHPWYRRRLRR